VGGSGVTYFPTLGNWVFAFLMSGNSGCCNEAVGEATLGFTIGVVPKFQMVRKFTL
jgi:hypothetical protein